MATEYPVGSGELVIYSGKEGRPRLQARLRDDTLWLTQKQMAELFGVQPPAISKHLKNIFETGELAEAAVVSVLESTAADGKTYATRFYNLDAVIAVGYRVNIVPENLPAAEDVKKLGRRLKSEEKKLPRQTSRLGSKGGGTKRQGK